MRRTVHSAAFSPANPACQVVRAAGTLDIDVSKFGVARATARRAVALLRDWDLVVTVPGMGTYVKRPGGQ